MKLAHVVYRTPRTEEMIRFYELALGARVVHRGDFVSFLTFDEEHHRMALVTIPPESDESGGSDHFGTGVDHVAYDLPDLDALGQVYRRMKDAGHEPYWAVDHGPTTSLYYRDPDGNQIEFQVDNFPTKDETAAFFATEAFAQNPIGAPYDPDERLGDREEHPGN